MSKRSKVDAARLIGVSRAKRYKSMEGFIFISLDTMINFENL
jgi:hypothetical protein